MNLNDHNSGTILNMPGFTTSQWIEIVVLVVSTVMYFCQLTTWQQDAWSYVFAIALMSLIVGNSCIT